MTDTIRRKQTELAIIGTGLAGTAAAVFAAERGISTTIIGNTGSLAYTTGYLDLLGADEQLQPIIDPWLGLDSFCKKQQNHPLSRLEPDEIRTAFSTYTAFLSDNGLRYTGPTDRNHTVLTPVGVTKQSLCLPQTMVGGIEALENRRPTLIVDFKGLKGFSARQFVANLTDRWPGLKATRLLFPSMEQGELYPEMAARSLEVPANLERFAELLIKAGSDSEYIGLPALLGIHRVDEIHSRLEELTSRRIFEIPAMPPSVAGVRLRELFERGLPAAGVDLIAQRKVTDIRLSKDQAVLKLRDSLGPIEISANTVLLCTGRFLSGGLSCRITGICEPLLNLPVYQPSRRDQWYRGDYLGAKGHEIHRTGIEVDDHFRPLGRNTACLHEHLFAAGTVLAHQDWIKTRSGAGIAIATGHRAIREIAHYLGK